MADKIVFMIADPDRLVVNEITACLKEEFPGAIVYNAVDGGEALKKLRNVPPKVFITGMELGTKITFTDLIRNMEMDRTLSAIPVAVLSDISDTEPRFKGDVTKGRIKFLSRPLQKDELAATVRAMLKAETVDNNQFQMLSLKAGEVLFLAGERADRAFLVKRGRLKASVTSEGKVIELGDVLAGEFVGEMAHITGEPRSADVRAIEETDLVEIPCGTLDMLVFSRPTWTKALLKTLCRRLRDANQKRI